MFIQDCIYYICIIYTYFFSLYKKKYPSASSSSTQAQVHSLANQQVHERALWVPWLILRHEWLIFRRRPFNSFVIVSQCRLWPAWSVKINTCPTTLGQIRQNGGTHTCETLHPVRIFQQLEKLHTRVENPWGFHV